jgi:hypothetical protein
MKTIATLFAAALLAASLVPAAAKQPASVRRLSPDALVADLYKQHQSKHSPFFQTRSRALLDRYFVKRLADLLWRDAIRSKGEVGALDGDPLFNAQDMEIKNFLIGRPDYENGKTTVPVSFDNFGEKQKIVFLLVSQNGIWKIEDIKYQDDTTLAGILRGDANKKSPK